MGVPKCHSYSCFTCCCAQCSSPCLFVIENLLFTVEQRWMVFKDSHWSLFPPAVLVQTLLLWRVVGFVFFKKEMWMMFTLFY